MKKKTTYFLASMILLMVRVAIQPLNANSNGQLSHSNCNDWCNVNAVQKNPDIACGVCYELCKSRAAPARSRRAGRGRASIQARLASRMITVCDTKGYGDLEKRRLAISKMQKELKKSLPVLKPRAVPDVVPIGSRVSPPHTPPTPPGSLRSIGSGLSLGSLISLGSLESESSVDTIRSRRDLNVLLGSLRSTQTIGQKKKKWQGSVRSIKSLKANNHHEEQLQVADALEWLWQGDSKVVEKVAASKILRENVALSNQIDQFLTDWTSLQEKISHLTDSEDKATLLNDNVLGLGDSLVGMQKVWNAAFSSDLLIAALRKACAMYSANPNALVDQLFSMAAHSQRVMDQLLRIQKIINKLKKKQSKKRF